VEYKEAAEKVNLCLWMHVVWFQSVTHAHTQNVCICMGGGGGR